jgi:tRNA (guanine6-N2)-methyltransferase
LRPGLFAAHTQPGFETVAESEIVARIPGARAAGTRVAPERAGMAFFEAARPDGLGSLRTAEDIFSVVGYRRGFGPGGPALEKIRAVARGAPYVEAALAARVKLFPASRAGRRLSFKVVARLSGEHEFRRVELKRAIETGVAERTDHAWRRAESRAEVEFWATMLGDELIIALRLGDDRMRIRDYKVANIPGSLRPSVAAAMAWLSQPRDDDVVLDPLCGAGTVLIERAHLGRYAMLLGGDNDRAALAAARENIGPRYKPIELRAWDATVLPLADASVDKIVTNLPWGIRHGSHRENRRLYPRLIAELSRVLKPGGMMVILTAERRLMRDVLAQGRLKFARVIPVTILGAPAAVYVCSAG